MGKISRYSNLYDKNNNLIRHVDDKTGRLKDYSIKELEAFIDTLDKNTQEYSNAIMVLTGMYQNPRTKEDEEYVKEMQANLIKQLSEQVKQKEAQQENVITTLNETSEELEDADAEEITEQ